MNEARPNNYLSKQHGSVLVYCLGVLVLIVLSVGYSFNVSRISGEKTRLQNTADSAAFSVAAVEARDLNFKSYTNRAMVANQVGLAQSISLISWARFATRYTENISHVASAFPPLRLAFAAVSKGIAITMKALEVATEIAITSINVIEQTLSYAQVVHHGGTLAMAEDIFDEVVKRNDPDVDRSISLSSAPFAAQYAKNHLAFTKRYSPSKVTKTNKAKWWTDTYDDNKKRMDEFRQVTLESRDDFSKNRTYDYVKSFTAVWKVLKLRVRKTGGSELTGSSKNPDEIGSYYTWSAMDTMAVHLKWYKCGSWRCRWRSWKEGMPIAWGAAATDGERSFTFFRELGGKHRYASSFRINKKTSWAAATEYTGLGPSGRFNGLQPFFDIKQDGLVSEGPGIAVVLTKPHSGGGVKTVKHTSFGGGSDDLNLEAEGGFFKNRLSALSQAVPYFSRPNDVSVFRRWDKKREYGNLYNPFWQPRLAEIKDSTALLRLAVTIL
ncbi:Putative Flp pilus-assembly TadE/G-like [Marinobacter daqiaonensis]|uniref:Putative Flp pilus-assembly TadE/G-like n=1 Tax=Marinobacter daqiaonensis TaxID=650891 RepID=A0A1I6I7S6_9GAMM|nr:Tad domain-containing protein [Marinobacter daqiaonensis]SFR62782.1 Putative Flp pilus-assembly TadE/G-like [Marinobacter daqiaonensis]